jgi:hypothetical protein
LAVEQLRTKIDFLCTIQTLKLAHHTVRILCQVQY